MFPIKQIKNVYRRWCITTLTKEMILENLTSLCKQVDSVVVWYRFDSVLKLWSSASNAILGDSVDIRRWSLAGGSKSMRLKVRP